MDTGVHRRRCLPGEFVHCRAHHASSVAAEVLALADQDTGIVSMVLAKTCADADSLCRALPDATACCAEDRRYNKQFSRFEQSVLKSLGGNNARFLRL